MTLYKKEIGAWGENVAVLWLSEHDDQIIARNVRTPYGEIVIIAKQADLPVFREVKTLTSSTGFFPEKKIIQKKTATCAERSPILHSRA